MLTCSELVISLSGPPPPIRGRRAVAGILSTVTILAIVDTLLGPVNPCLGTGVPIYESVGMMQTLIQILTQDILQ